MTERHSQNLSNEEHENVMSYLLDWMTPSDFCAFQENLANSSIQKQLVGDYAKVIGLLAEELPEVEPPPSLKSKLLQSVFEEPSTSPMSAMIPEMIGNDSLAWIKEKTWKDSPWPGIRSHTLFIDSEAKNRGVLLNISPGALYPAHRHLGPEHFFLIQGDLLISDLHGSESVAMKAGDFQSSPTGSEHGRLHSPNGCIALVISSTEDAFLEVLPK